MPTEPARSNSASAAVSASLRDLPELWMPEDVVDRIARALAAELRKVIVEDEIIDLTTSAPHLDELVAAEYSAPRRRATA